MKRLLILLIFASVIHIRRSLIYYTLFVLLLLPGIGGRNLHAQSVNLGNPPVKSFNKQQYKAGTQIWDIAQGPDGVMWFANNDGLLEFDGMHWRLYPIGNETIVRSVRVGQKGRVYVGGQGDMGYFEPGDHGQMQYHTLRDLLPVSEQRFGDVWDVLICEDDVFFRTDNQVFHFKDGKIRALFPPGRTLLYMGTWKDKMVVQDGDLTLHVFENDRLRPLGAPSAFTHGTISAILPWKSDTLLVTTIKDGIFACHNGRFERWPTLDDHFLRENRIFCAELMPDGKLALGTSLNGLVTLDAHRRLYHHVNKKSGLQNNTVLSLFPTPNGGLWLGLDNGADFVELHSPFSTLFPDGEFQGTGYTVQIYQDKIYFGTNTGLYAADWKQYYRPEEKQRFVQVQNSGGQVWSLHLLENQLLMGHHEGAFRIEGLTAHQIARVQGIWKFVRLGPQLAVAGHYNGLALFRHTSGNWQFDKVLNGFSESSRFLALDHQDNLWMSHPYRGIYQIRVDAEQGAAVAKFMDQALGLPSNLGNHLFQLGPKIIFTPTHGAFEYDYSANRFVANANFDRLLGPQTRIKYLRQDEEGNIWYATSEETGVLIVENDALAKKVRRVPIPELKDKMTGGFHFLLPVDAHNVFIATGQGFIHFNPAAYKAQDNAIRIVLHEVRIEGEKDSLLYGGHSITGHPGEPVKLPNHLNTISFSFSAPDYPGGEYVRYAWQLEGAGDQWSEWSSQPDLVLNRLNAGDYVFRVKAINQYGVESAAQSFAFRILPPWYASRLAFLTYWLLLIGIVAGIIYRQQRRFEKEKKDLQSLHQHKETLHQLNARRSEEEINRLQNEKLAAEIAYKSQELASATMHLVQKNEILNTIREALGRLEQKAAADPEVKKEVSRILKVVEQDASIDADWEHFSHNFDQVHSDFLKRLSEQYAHLSPNDYKLCAYLRMNLSSKEIATLLNISVRGVEASRYRLRKRLGLDTETNLTEFLMRF